VLKLYFFYGLHPLNHLEFLALLLTYLMPLAMMAIRWKSAFGDHSPISMVLTSFLFHLVCAGFLIFCIWMAFDPPFSPRQLNLGTPLLTLYYLGALSIGYFSGYFLLVFGKAPSSRLQSPQPDPFQFLNPLVITGVWVLAVATITGLACRNAPQIRDTNDDIFKKYASFVEENLPRSGGILLSDDQYHLFFVAAALARDGRAKDFLLLDTQSLNWPPYHRFLHDAKMAGSVFGERSETGQSGWTTQRLGHAGQNQRALLPPPKLRLLFRAILSGAARSGLQTKNTAQ
jgi:hypothetical protein